jgi:hypothetical protein
MRSEQEIRGALADCHKAIGLGMSNGPCPRRRDGGRGCCAECSFPSTVEWVLGADRKASRPANPIGLADPQDLDEQY